MEYHSILRSNFSRNEYKRYISFERQSLGRLNLNFLGFFYIQKNKSNYTILAAFERKLTTLFDCSACDKPPKTILHVFSMFLFVVEVVVL